MHAKEVFFKMTPGVPLMRLHGKMKQHQRMATYDEFCRKDRALLLATDLVARGMDFPNVDWVVQLDCPESVDEYIHSSVIRNIITLINRFVPFKSCENSL